MEKIKENIVNVECTFRMKVLVLNGMDIDRLLEEETEYLAEPQTANGLVMNIDLKDIKKI